MPTDLKLNLFIPGVTAKVTIIDCDGFVEVWMVGWWLWVDHDIMSTSCEIVNPV